MTKNAFTGTTPVYYIGLFFVMPLDLNYTLPYLPNK